MQASENLHNGGNREALPATESLPPAADSDRTGAAECRMPVRTSPQMRIPFIPPILGIVGILGAYDGVIRCRCNGDGLLDEPMEEGAARP